MSWAIICDARFGAARGIALLALVDRHVRKDVWWTSDDPDAVMRFESRPAAELACRKYRRNRARVVSGAEAVDAVREQRSELERQSAEAEAEMGWDSHKTH